MMPPTFIDLTTDAANSPRPPCARPAILSDTNMNLQPIIKLTDDVGTQTRHGVVDVVIDDVLQDAINVATLPTLRGALRMICRENSEAARLAGEYFHQQGRQPVMEDAAAEISKEALNATEEGIVGRMRRGES